MLVGVNSKKQLEMLLESIAKFSKPKIRLEQYTLPAKVAAELLWYIELRYGDIRGLKVVDLGCGTGILALGAALLGASHVIGLDLDVEALKQALISKYSLKLDNVDFILGDVNKLPIKNEVVDTVLQNPPFGVHRKGLDVMFLKVFVT